MEKIRRSWPTAHADACDAKKERKPLKVWFHDDELELTVVSIREHRLGDQVLLQGDDIVVGMAITTGSDQVELSFYPKG